MTALEKQLTEALQTIGCLPLEFNGRARAIAQKAVEPPKGGWKFALSPEQITKILTWAPPTKETFYMEQEQSRTSAGAPAAKTEAPAYLPPAIDMIPVTSSNIESVGHDGVETLRVKFINGSAYDYVGVQEDQFFDLINAESVGKAYGALTRGNGLKGIKLEVA